MMECLSLSVLLLEDNSFFYEMQGGLQLHGILSSSPLYFEFKLMGASRPQTPRCFLVLDYLFSSTRKLQFYVELALWRRLALVSPQPLLIMRFECDLKNRVTSDWCRLRSTSHNRACGKVYWCSRQKITKQIVGENRCNNISFRPLNGEIVKEN